MTGRTHDAIAFASLITIATFYPPDSMNLATASAAIVGNIVGSTIPDLDQAGNRLYKLLPAGQYLGKILRKFFLGHRTLSHSILGLILFNYVTKFLLNIFLNPSYINLNIVYIAIMIGYVSHLLGDAITKEGIPIFFPLKIKIGFPPVEGLRITTGKFIENIIILPGVAAYIFWFIGRYQQQVFSLIKLINSV